MSADNGVYVLRTFTNYIREGNSVTYVKNRFPVWRVAYATAIDNFEYIKSSKPENIGAYMVDVWKDSDIYTSEEEAILAARAIANGLQASGQYLEYGVNVINTDYTFYKD